MYGGSGPVQQGRGLSGIGRKGRGVAPVLVLETVRLSGIVLESVHEQVEGMSRRVEKAFVWKVPSTHT